MKTELNTELIFTRAKKSLKKKLVRAAKFTKRTESDVVRLILERELKDPENIVL